MRIDEVPHARMVGQASEKDQLELTIKRASNARTFSHFTIISGAPRSGRIFSDQPFADSVPFPRPLSQGEIAKDLVRLAEQEARYESRPHRLSKKGWEIYQAEINGNPVIVAWAAWC